MTCKTFSLNSDSQSLSWTAPSPVPPKSNGNNRRHVISLIQSPTVNWIFPFEFRNLRFRNGTKLSEKDNIKFSHEDGTHSITITKPKKEDIGSYSCMADGPRAMNIEFRVSSNLTHTRCNRIVHFWILSIFILTIIVRFCSGARCCQIQHLVQRRWGRAIPFALCGLRLPYPQGWMAPR